ncbi:MAG: tRNA/rRNA methyltransferase [Candidatus Tokpelaia hoelldobleri]|uniref:tRNA/rRNA methyltransferase n=1 Tax=Candidatus Tokpelaia hoelldobleri TaxID=1902579 RepID=A0A1U9JSA2_9HYPH|nr:MAG: tRNA/rRNA methyltransferase [Candidatus Tokpelaia hoelldoblerii]
MTQHTHNKPKSGQVKEITSAANPVIKDLRALSQKKYRDREGIFLAEGLKLVTDALDLDWVIRTFVFARTALDNPLVAKTAARARAAGALVIEANNKVMEAITRRDNPQNVIAVFEQRWCKAETMDFARQTLLLGLDRVRDPGNLGTIIRTADAVGASGILLIGDTTDPFSLEAVRATRGSVFAVPLYRLGEQKFLDWRRSFSGMVVGTHLQGAVDYRQIDYKKEPMLLLMGNEQQGLSDNLAAACDRLARIPQAGQADSLNLAVATGVMLYEMRRNHLTLDVRSA